MRSGRKIEKSASFWEDDLEWLDAEAARRKAGRSDILGELIAEARGRAAGDDMVDMLVSRLEAVEQHVRAIRATIGTEVQLPYLGEERRPRTWADRKALIEKMTEKLDHGS
ncbi:hypothetical protein GGE65_007836 [Skermanella aerolata]|uniref:hypothetical protein n=1 Tax=Skermanella aerolata TaxID=393310 RepID=UPI003D1D4AE2